MSKDDHYVGALLEDIDSKFDRIIEVVGALSDEMKTKADKDDIRRIEARLDTIETAVKDNSSDIHSHERHITKLEARQA